MSEQQQAVVPVDGEAEFARQYVCPGCGTTQADFERFGEMEDIHSAEYAGHKNGGVKAPPSFRDEFARLGARIRERLECKHPRHVAPTLRERQSAQLQALYGQAEKLQALYASQGHDVTIDECLRDVLEDRIEASRSPEDVLDELPESRPVDPAQGEAGAASTPAQNGEGNASDEFLPPVTGAEGEGNSEGGQHEPDGAEGQGGGNEPAGGGDDGQGDAEGANGIPHGEGAEAGLGSEDAGVDA